MTRSPLVDAEGLAAELDGRHPPLLLDVRWRLGAGSLRDDYLAGNVAGAVWVVLDADLAGAARCWRQAPAAVAAVRAVHAAAVLCLGQSLVC